MLIVAIENMKKSKALEKNKKILGQWKFDWDICE